MNEPIVAVCYRYCPVTAVSPSVDYRNPLERRAIHRFTVGWQKSCLLPEYVTRINHGLSFLALLFTVITSYRLQ
jgi:hypothetical protein